MKKLILCLLLFITTSFGAYTSSHSAAGSIVYNHTPYPYKVPATILTHPLFDILIGETYMGNDWYLKEIAVTGIQYQSAKQTGKLKQWRRGSFYGNVFDFLDKGLFSGSVSDIFESVPIVGDFLRPLAGGIIGHEIIHSFFRIDPIIKMNNEQTFMFNIGMTFAMAIDFELTKGKEVY